jgi:hypothetical protein
MKRYFVLLIVVAGIIFYFAWAPEAGGFVAHAATMPNQAASTTIVIGQEIPIPITPFKVTSTCDWAFSGDSCVSVRTGPGVSYDKAKIYLELNGSRTERVRDGEIFYISALVPGADGRLWLKIWIDRKALSHPERVKGDWYVAADYFSPIRLSPIDPQTDTVKSINVSLHKQELYAYEGDRLVKTFKVSTGRDDLGTPTRPGHFRVYGKSPMKIMEGPLPGMSGKADEYTLFVPFAMAFTSGPDGTEFIHSATWHNSFGKQHSHGCINLTPDDAEWLYNWTPDTAIRQTPVTIVP